MPWRTGAGEPGTIGLGKGELFAISDIHVEHEENRQALERFRSGNESDWLLVAGDVANDVDLFEWALRTLKAAFGTVVWAPGNHELHVVGGGQSGLRGEARYMDFVERCRALGVVTPEDPYPVWDGAWGPIRIVPMFLLYDYSFRGPGLSKREALEEAFDVGVVCDDEFVLDPHPHASREAWCEHRIRISVQRLESVEPPLPAVLTNHFPLKIEATEALLRPQFAQWCGTRVTSDWHRRFRAAAVVHGHLHIPRTMWHDGVPFVEVSLGNPREWRGRAPDLLAPRKILPKG